MTLVPSLVEVLPDPQVTSYRVRVEMRQEASYNVFGEVGVYVGHTLHTTAEGPQHFFAKAGFSDLGQGALSFQDEEGRRGSAFRLSLWLSGSSTRAPGRKDSISVPGVFYVPKDPMKGPGPWRTLAVEVSPGMIRAGWEGRTVSLAPAEKLAAWLPLVRRDFPDLAGVEVQVPGRGAIGIYLYGSSVSVRRFTVEPLTGISY
jgi:hypothetical protein